MASHRTSPLGELSAPLSWLRELRYHEASRQSSGFLLAMLVTWLGEPSMFLWILGAPLVVLSIIIRIWASGYVLKNRELATDGPYTFVRHPLYTGNLVGLVGFALGCGLWWSWVVLAALVWLFYPAAVEYEDRKLRGFFGRDWTRWASVTPALIPGIRRQRPQGRGLESRAGGRWSFGKSLRQNGEPVIALFVAFLYTYLLAKAL